MTISVFDLFKVGIGPSSSHTVGPMLAAARFVADLERRGTLPDVSGLRVDLYGSLAATALGHGTLPAILLGLQGYYPDTIESDEMEQRLAAVRATGQVALAGSVPIAFAEDDIARHPRTVLSRHPNGMTITATACDGRELHSETYFSIGGGFVITESEPDQAGPAAATPWSFSSAAQLLDLTDRHNLRISDVMLRHELATRSHAAVREQLLHLRDVMIACEHRGISRDGYLPGDLRVRRRARDWYLRLIDEDPGRDPAFAEDWVNLVALAVNEENASGGRIVTAPTNGAAGIIPAVMHYAVHYTGKGTDPDDPDDTAMRFLLTAGAIGSLYKERASISGAEVGCQGEVGSAASMAAGALAEILGGTPRQVENAAEIAMEHSLGLTCDPIAGLVQVPCIERNAISAGKAINAARMALRGDGTHRVSLDEVIATMRSTGADMNTKYKETATGGLAVNVPVNLVDC
ncbi:L-serine ammonia-lyase [Mycobacterium simulans]|uniref:L-serine ammonia-lyase n=1 Tax=Mycobacterium simulans TaxID=627089 RepID=UPI001641C26F|nr:L-serine ammonia-lyase [Mycobacterium simulans]